MHSSSPGTTFLALLPLWSPRVNILWPAKMCFRSHIIILHEINYPRAAILLLAVIICVIGGVSIELRVNFCRNYLNHKTTRDRNELEQFQPSHFLSGSMSTRTRLDRMPAYFLYILYGLFESVRRQPYLKMLIYHAIFKVGSTKSFQVWFSNCYFAGFPKLNRRFTCLLGWNIRKKKMSMKSLKLDLMYMIH